MAQTLPISGDGADTPSPALTAPVTGWTPPTLLDDAPATADGFGGGHARLARSLAGIIRDERGGRAIALTGTYGSGKSTVVQLAEAQLQEEHVAVFTFDAWSHSGDPLRRSFIEELVAFLDGRKWTTAKEWRKDLLRLSRQRDKTRVKSTPKLTLAGGLMAVALLFVPLGTAMLAKNDMAAARGLIGAVLLLLPFVIVVAAWALSDDKAKALKNILPLLFRDRQRKTNSTTIRTPDPTTVEFRDVFRRVVGRALGGGNQRTLVVVIDNLDRLQADEATAAWSVMRTFFDGAARSGWENRFWTVAPLDLDALAVRRATPDQAEPTGGVGRRPDDDLITKTFAVTLRVPPPVLSEWRDFFAAQLEKAFPYWTARPGELRAVYDLFLRLRVVEKGPPTPRAIKSFVNRLGALDRQWGGTIPLRTLALYLLVGEVSRNGAEIAAEGFVTDDVQAILGNEWRRDLAAVHFNVEPDKAFQVLVGERVETALETGDANRLRELAGTAGLGEAVLAVVRSAAPSWSLSRMAMSASTLADADFDRTPGLDGAWAALAREAVRRREALLKEAPDLTSSPVRSGLALLVREAPPDQQKDVVVTIARALSGSGALSVSADPESGSVTPVWWARAAEELVGAAKGDAERGLSHLTVPAQSADDYLLTLVAIAGGGDPQDTQPIAKHARPGGAVTTPSAVTEALVKRIGDGEFSAVVRALDVLPHVTRADGAPVAWAWDDVVAALQREGDPDVSVDSVEVGAVVNALLRLRDVPIAAPAARKALAALVPDALLQQLSAHADEAAAAGPILIALLSYPTLVKVPAAEATPTAIGVRRTAGYKTFETILARPSQHAATVGGGASSAPPSALRDLVKSGWIPDRNKALLRTVVQSATVRADVADIFDLEALLVGAALIRDAAGAEWFGGAVRDRIATVLRNGGIPVGVRTMTPAAFDAVTASLSPEDALAYRADVLEKYTELDEDNWHEIATGERPSVLALAVRLASEGDRVGPGSELAGALLTVVKSVIDGTRDGVTPEAAGLYALLPQRAREGFLARLRGLVLDVGLEGLRVALSGPYGADLARADGWDRVSERVVSDFLPGIVDKGRGEEVAWAADLLEQTDVLASADRGINAALLDRVEGRFTRKSRSSGIVRKGLLRIEAALSPHVPKSRRRKKGFAKLAEDAKAVLFGSSTPVRRQDPEPRALENSTPPDEPNVETDQED